MSTDIHSPVKRWPGTVTLPAYLNYPQYRAWIDAARAARSLIEANKPENAAPDASWEYDRADYVHAWLPGIFAVVEAWRLAGLPETLSADTFPLAPEQPAEALFNWLVDGIRVLVSAVDGDDPK